ncbi:MAG: nicotinamidase, partial [Vicinamibacteria bacterium]|nr:nicotinamidase [Vicinamibacteria bacterium]
MAARLPVPAFFNVAHVRHYDFRPDAQRLFEDAVTWGAAHAIPTAGLDTRRVLLLLIDLQKDFCFPEGSLFVGGRSGTGAMDDNERIARFIYRELSNLTEIVCTLDTHLPYQIFFASFWVDSHGQPLKPHSLINATDIASGVVHPSPAVAAWLCDGDLAWLQRQVEDYCRALEAAGKYTLYLWPPHCLAGDAGHALAGAIQQARLFHAYARGTRNDIVWKGDQPLTEHYSALCPEVTKSHDGRTLGQRDNALIDRLLAADAVVVAGQAASHCVQSTLADLLAAIQERDASLARKIYIL